MKKPAWHRQQGLDLTRVVFEVMREFGYESRPGEAYLQSFDPDALIRLRDEFKSTIPRIQLIADNSWWPDRVADYDALRQPAGLAAIAMYADGVGVWLNHLAAPDATLKVLPLAEQARAAGLLIHAYTVRADRLPAWASSHETLETVLSEQVGVDGWFTDHPDGGAALARSAR